jgi:hypothetical protein
VFRQLQNIYEILSDPERRTSYDTTLRPGTDSTRSIQGSGAWYQPGSDPRAVDLLKRLSVASRKVLQTSSKAIGTLVGRTGAGRRDYLLAAAWLTVVLLAVGLFYFLIVESQGLILVLFALLGVGYWLYERLRRE